MAMAVQTMHPMAQVPLVLGVLRRLEVATVIDRLIPPHPAHSLSCGRGVEAMILSPSWMGIIRSTKAACAAGTAREDGPATDGVGLSPQGRGRSR